MWCILSLSPLLLQKVVPHGSCRLGWNPGARVVTGVVHTHIVHPTPSARQRDSSGRIKGFKAPHTIQRFSYQATLSSPDFCRAVAQAARRHSRKPEGQEIKSKALQTSWKEAPVSLIANYHSSQLPDSQRLRPHRDALTLLSTVARQGHTSNSSTAASLQGGLNEEKREEKNTLGFIYTWKFLWMLNN